MKIYINRRPGVSIMNEIYLVNEPGTNLVKGSIIQFLNFTETGEALITEKHHDYGMVLDMKPTMILPEAETRELIAAFIAYAREQGLKFNSESKAEGKLEAMGAHLNDLRTLLKLTK